MSVAAFYNLSRPVEFDEPLRASVDAVAAVVERVHIDYDPRFEDGTHELCQELAGQYQNVTVEEANIPLNVAGPLGQWKTETRRKLGQDWLIEMEPYWVIDRTVAPLFQKVLPPLPRSVVSIGLGSVNYFNGWHVKHAIPKVLPVLSRNHPDLHHGGKERMGAGLLMGSRDIPVPVSVNLCTDGWRGQSPPDFNSPNTVYIQNFEYYAIPTAYERKTMSHYFQGKLDGAYDNIEDYRTDLDGEPVDMFGVSIRRRDGAYRDTVIAEMADPTVRRCSVNVSGDHLGAWEARQRVMRVGGHLVVGFKVARAAKAVREAFTTTRRRPRADDLPDSDQPTPIF